MVDMDSHQNKKIVDRRRNSFHLVFVPKYRYKMFGKLENRKLVKSVLTGIAEKYGMKIYSIEAGPDHIHLFVEIPVTMSVWTAMRKLRNLSARTLFQIIPGYRKRYPKGRFWSGYKYYESIGRVTATKIQKYIEDNQSKHWV